MPSSTSGITFGSTVAAAIIKQKRTFESEGRIYRQSDIAALIDALLPSYVDRFPIQPATFALETAPVSASSNPSPFGSAKVIPPSPENVAAYSLTIGFPLDGQKWCDTYAAKGWVVSGRAKMKDWQAAVRNWKANGWGKDSGIALSPPSAKPAVTSRDYSKI